MTTIGKITKEQIIKSRKKASREIEVQNSIGWTATHKVHKTVKNYTRKPKYKKDYSAE
jgi:hypothetical protein